MNPLNRVFTASTKRWNSSTPPPSFRASLTMALYTSTGMLSFPALLPFFIAWMASITSWAEMSASHTSLSYSTSPLGLFTALSAQYVAFWLCPSPAQYNFSKYAAHFSQRRVSSVMTFPSSSLSIPVTRPEAHRILFASASIRLFATTQKSFILFRISSWQHFLEKFTSSSSRCFLTIDLANRINLVSSSISFRVRLRRMPVFLSSRLSARILFFLRMTRDS